MRLLDTGTLELREFQLDTAPDYVILSHRWAEDQDEELTFEDLRHDHPIRSSRSRSRRKPGFQKVQGVCDLAKRDSYKWVWIDSCCIDRSSSAELQETINSMWNYYRQANICYVYLYDVTSQSHGWTEQFSRSSWWYRGWTLQELLAPDIVEFYAQDWSPIGTKAERYSEISFITNINPEILTLRANPGKFSAAEKLSWAAHRQVTRQEDEAYSLLGLFNVSMPLLYGEGRTKAFLRLQQTYFAAAGDASMFLYRYSQFPDSQPLLADCPTKFCPRQKCTACSHLTVCFPLACSYDRVCRGKGWLTQAHDSILPSNLEVNHTFATSLQLLHRTQLPTDVSDGLASNREVTHVAVLNHTLFTYPKSVFCLPLCFSHKYGGDSFTRPKIFPFLLSLAFTDKSECRRVMLYAGLQDDDREEVARTEVTLSGLSCIAEGWECSKMKSFTSGPVETQPYCTIEAKRSFMLSLVSTITIRTAPSSVIKVRAEPNDDTWSIKSVHEVDGAELYIAESTSDRCRVRLANGTNVSISLRRLPAAFRPRNAGLLRSLRFQLTVIPSLPSPRVAPKRISSIELPLRKLISK